MLGLLLRFAGSIIMLLNFGEFLCFFLYFHSISDFRFQLFPFFILPRFNNTFVLINLPSLVPRLSGNKDTSRNETRIYPHGLTQKMHALTWLHTNTTTDYISVTHFTLLPAVCCCSSIQIVGYEESPKWYG